MLKIIESKNDIDKLLTRSQLDMDEKNQVVKAIVADVKSNKDKALFAYTEKFDGIKLDINSILLTKKEIDDACNLVPKKTMNALINAKKNIEDFHKRQLRSDNIITENGRTTGYIMRAVERVGIYVPGGKASYPSSVLMCAIPALVAGVKEIVMVTPGGIFLNSTTIAAARLCGIERIFKVGGAQAIAALAFGTQSVPKVDVISGPGNIYVALAKREVFGSVGIDMIAGPSEILIVADETANVSFVAADMLSQSEHDELAMSMLITTSESLSKDVQIELSKQIEKLDKKEIAQKSLENYGAIVLVKNIDEAIELANKVAPEHLELCIKDLEKHLPKIQNAGAVFAGNYSPEPLGDYYAGPNHVLPTSGTARFFSALSVDNYMKKISLINFTREALLEDCDDIIELANSEGLTAHANSIIVRKENK